MFTGIVTDIGEVRALMPGGDLGYRIATRYDTAEIAQGASIACAGVCLTVVDKSAQWFAVQVSAETRARSTVGAWRVGTKVNLERALKLGDELGGHIVTGHVDTVAELIGKRAEGDSVRLVFSVPPPFEQAIAAKGSVAVDGVSLTVNETSPAGEREGGRFGVNIIPHTQALTTLGQLAVGDHVNLEIDLLARYVARLLGKGIA